MQAGVATLQCTANRAELYQKNGDVLLVCKAFNGRVVTQWLTETINAFAEQGPSEHMNGRIAPIALCMLLVWRKWLYGSPSFYGCKMQTVLLGVFD